MTTSEGKRELCAHVIGLHQLLRLRNHNSFGQKRRLQK